MSLSREQVGALAAQLRDHSEVVTMSKQEVVRILLPDIEALKAQGLSNRRILDLLRKRGLELGTVDVMKNYLQRARKAAARDVNAPRMDGPAPLPKPPRATSASALPGPRPVSFPRAETRASAGFLAPTDGVHVTPHPQTPKPGHFIPVLHRQDQDL